MTEVNQYKIYCTTDSKFEYVWGTQAPTTCPINTAHSVDANSIAIVKTIGEPIITIKEENISTGGFFRSESVRLDIGANETKISDFTWPIPISVLQITVFPNVGMDNDKVSVGVAPNTTVGVLTATGATGATILNVSSTVTGNIKLGFHASLLGHTGASVNLGRVKNVDTVNGQITTELPISVHDFAPNITQVKQDIYMMYKHEMPSTAIPFTVGNSKIGASYIPANTVIRATYENSNATPKTFLASIEYLY